MGFIFSIIHREILLGSSKRFVFQGIKVFFPSFRRRTGTGKSCCMCAHRSPAYNHKTHFDDSLIGQYVWREKAVSILNTIEKVEKVESL